MEDKKVNWDKTSIGTNSDFSYSTVSDNADNDSGDKMIATALEQVDGASTSSRQYTLL